MSNPTKTTLQKDRISRISRPYTSLSTGPHSPNKKPLPPLPKEVNLIDWGHILRNSKYIKDESVEYNDVIASSSMDFTDCPVQRFFSGDDRIRMKSPLKYSRRKRCLDEKL